MTRLAATFALLTVVAYVHGEAERNRVAPVVERSFTVRAGSSLTFRSGQGRGELWRAVLGPEISAELAADRGRLWVIMPWLFVVGVFPQGRTTASGGTGDLRIGLSYVLPAQAVSLRIGVSLGWPTGIGEKHEIRLYKFVSGSGEFIATINAAIAYIRDPVALRLQSELVFGLSADPPVKQALRRGTLHGSALLVLNRVLAVDIGLSGSVEARSSSFPEIAGQIGLVVSHERMSATLRVIEGLWPENHTTVDVAIGVAWSL